MSNYGGWPGQPGHGGWVYAPPAPKPGVISLHPLVLADILSGIFATIRQYFKALYAPLAVIALVTAALAAAGLALCYSPLHSLYLDIQQQNHVTNSQRAEILAFFGGFWLFAAVAFICWYASASLISTTVLRHAVIGRRVTVRQILDEARARVWQLLGGYVLLVLALLGPLVVAIAVTIALAALSPNGAAAGFGFLLILPAMAWTILLSYRVKLLVPVIVLENARPRAAFGRAWRLNQGNWWRTFGITLLVTFIGSAASQVVYTPVSLLTTGSIFNSFPQPGEGWTASDLPGFGSVWLYVIGLVVTAVTAGILILPLLPLCTGLLYVDRRIRRESLDEQLAEEAGVSLHTPQAAPPQGFGWPGQPPYGQPPYGQPPYGTPVYGQHPYGQAPYGNWPGQPPQPPQPGWPGWGGAQPPPAPPVPPTPEGQEPPEVDLGKTPPPDDSTPSA